MQEATKSERKISHALVACRNIPVRSFQDPFRLLEYNSCLKTVGLGHKNESSIPFLYMHTRKDNPSSYMDRQRRAKKDFRLPDSPSFHHLESKWVAGRVDAKESTCRQLCLALVPQRQKIESKRVTARTGVDFGAATRFVPCRVHFVLR